MVYAARVAQDPAAPEVWRVSALRNFNVGALQMGMATAHEVVHKWVNYLTGDFRAGTPPNISYPGQAGGPQRGESGWYWESRFIGGGLLEFHEDVSDPLRERQAGKIYHSRMDGKRVEWAWELDPLYIQRILNFGSYACKDLLLLSPLR